MKINKTEWIKHKILFTAVLAVCINFFVECLSRRGLIKGVVHIVTAPYIFMLNTLIVALTLSIAWLFHRRKFMFLLVSLLWVLAGIVDYVILIFRKTPFTANDFLLLADAVKIAKSYVNVFGIILMCCGAVAALAGIVYYFLKSEISAEKIDYIRTAGSIGLLYIGLSGMFWLGIRTGQIAPRFGNITTAFEEYGFAYCFTNSIFDNGIDKPDTYKEMDFTEMDIKVPKPEEVKPEPEPEKKDDVVNIIFLQLESFMNPELVKDASYSMVPAPNFKHLYDKYPSGYLIVPSFGAGTANTEFEVITGMNLDDFGTGEYPFKTVLKNQACETICYNLRTKGYTAHALHNNDGSFYNRFRVYANLGFDEFVSIEYMKEVPINPVGWAKDEVLTEYIMEMLDSTEGSDFIYAISVQGHGDYPESEAELENLTKENPLRYPIEVNNYFNENEAAGFSYYVSQVKEMDDFIGQLVGRLARWDEKVVLVMYGDHLPGFTFADENLTSGDIYKSQYVIWSNFDAGFSDKDLEAFQLSSQILGKLGITEGVVNSYHQKYADREDYLEKLTLLEYDILYGEKKVYGYQNIYEAADMRMGLREITIKKAYNYNGRACIEGNDFNKYSFVMINGKEYETICINPHTLVVPRVQLADGDVLSVVQHGSDGIILSATQEFVYENAKKPVTALPE